MFFLAHFAHIAELVAAKQMITSFNFQKYVSLLFSMCFLKMFLAQVAHVAMFESSLWWATATLVVQQMISKTQFEKICFITFLNVSPQIVSCARCNVWVRLGSLWWRNRRWTSGLVFQTRKQRFNKMHSFNVHLQAFFLMQVAFCIHCNGRVRNTWTGCQQVGIKAQPGID